MVSGYPTLNYVNSNKKTVTKMSKKGSKKDLIVIIDVDNVNNDKSY